MSQRQAQAQPDDVYDGVRWLDWPASLQCIQDLRLPLMNEPQASSPYDVRDIYEPLKVGFFRLLHLWRDPRRLGVPLCELEHVSVEQAVSFTAVSYTWLDEGYSWYGRPLPQLAEIEINGKVCLLPGRVAHILSLLERRGITTVWIDAVCINQMDDAEKGHQVARMGKIYSSANDVAVILGKPSDDTDLALSRRSIELYRQGHHVSTPDSSIPHKSVRRGFVELGSHKYWIRAWILQEAALAKTLRIMCGNAELSGTLSADLLEILSSLGPLGGFPQENQASIKTISSFAQDSKPEILEVLKNTQDCLCSDTRDIIYSKLALTSNPEVAGDPDYTISIASLFLQVATNHIQSTGGLEVLPYAATHFGRSNDELPSWVPDWGFHMAHWQNGFDPDIRADSFNLHSLSVTNHPRPRVLGRELVATGTILKKMCPSHDDNDCLTRPGLATNNTMRCTQWSKWWNWSDLFLCLLDDCSSLLVLRRLDRERYALVNMNVSVEKMLWVYHECHHFSGSWNHQTTRTTFRIV